MAVRKSEPMDASDGQALSEPTGPAGGSRPNPAAKTKSGARNGAKGSARSTGEAKTRVTVDLEQGDHRALRRELMQMAEDLGRTRVTTQDVGAALFRLFLDDPTLVNDVREALRS